MRGQQKRLQCTVRSLPDEDETIGIDLGQLKPSMPFHKNKSDDEIASRQIISVTKRRTPKGTHRGGNHGTPGTSPSADQSPLARSHHKILSCTPCTR